MNEPIDFYKEHEKRYGPDADHVFIDRFGDKWFRFIADYKDADRTFSFDIWAYSREDAERRIKLIKESAKIEGQIYGRIPADQPPYLVVNSPKHIQGEAACT